MQRVINHVAAVIGLLALTGCGGGGGGGQSGTITPPTNPGSTGGPWTAGVFQASSTFDALCANPRTGNDSRGRPFPDRRGTVTDENNWLRSWTNELYLWYNEVEDRNPALYSNAEEYFELLKTNARTSSGTPKDQFHFTYDTADWEALSQSGVSAGYGATFTILSGAPPRQVVVALVEPNSPAAAAGVVRGDEAITIDGVDVVNGNNVDALNAGLFPSAANQPHSFVFRRTNGTTFSVSMTSDNVRSTPVHTVSTIPTASGNVGYILFNDHIAPAESSLITAIDQLRSENIVDLVLDLRYNGGGYLDIASELAYMIAGDSTAGRTFERTIFNNKYTTTNPVTGQALTPTPFHSRAVGITGGATAGTVLPTLNLTNRRVFVLTTDDTCSASEAIINGLRGVDFEVIQIGRTTCGKPYGFYAFDNCGTTYFSIQFQGVNAKNFGEFTDGFAPNNSPGSIGTRITGCAVNDDFTQQLGNANERMLSVALNYRTTNTCSLPPPTSVTPQQLQKFNGTVDPSQVLRRPPWREMRLLSAQ